MNSEYYPESVSASQQNSVTSEQTSANPANSARDQSRTHLPELDSVTPQPKPEAKENYLRFFDGEEGGSAPTESTLQYLNFFQRIAQSFASACGLYVIPKNHIHNWDNQEFEIKTLEGDDFARGQTLGSCLTINSIVMAINEYNLYHRGRPHRNILKH